MQADLITFIDREYLRTGECDGCKATDPGACCKFIVMPERPLTADELKWVRLHPGVEGLTGRHDIPCSALSEGVCTLYGSPERPEMCVRYPEMPEQLIPGCAYTLTEV